MLSSSTICTDALGNPNSNVELKKIIGQATKGEVAVQYLHPHPQLTRMLCLWAGKRRWSRSRHHYKTFVRTASRKKGFSLRDEQIGRWKDLSRVADKGLQSLEWRQIRRIVGLTPWGEQILYRLKLQAYSLYDKRNAKLGCPHAECV
eukprot:jgi/Phyca11/130168/e_gw1.91.99.1